MKTTNGRLVRERHTRTWLYPPGWERFYVVVHESPCYIDVIIHDGTQSVELGMEKKNSSRGASYERDIQALRILIDTLQKVETRMVLSTKEAKE